MKTYKFKKPLVEGVIVERQHSFIMMVEYQGEIVRCHCPCMSRIGHINIEGRPCLLLESDNPNRKTRFTVEAISLNKPEDKRKKWIGINQTDSNRYVEHYLKENAFKEMIDSEGLEVLREQCIGNSRLDFKVGDTYIENKTILRLDMPIPDYIETKKKPTKIKVSDHFYKHVNELKESLKDHERAILLGTFLYDNHYTSLADDRDGDKEKRIETAMSKGVEGWQACFEITPTEVKFVRVEKL